LYDIEAVRAAIERGPVPCSINPFEYCICGSGLPFNVCCGLFPFWAYMYSEQRMESGPKQRKPTPVEFVMEQVTEAGGTANWDGLIESTKFSNKKLGDTLRELFADGLLIEIRRGVYATPGEGVVIEAEHTMAPTLDAWFMRRQT
jgi:hypothetical protein